MTAMINLVQHEQLPRTVPGSSKQFASYWLPALVTVVLHGAMASLLLSDWQPGVAAAPAAATLQTRLVTLPQPEPVAEPPAPPKAEPAPPAPPRPEPQAVEPPIAQPAPEPEPDYAAIARKRAEQREREKLAEQRKLQEQRQAEQARLEQQRAEEARAEQQRLERERLAAERAAAQRALQAQQAARQKAAAQDISQYQPISKQAPAYPRRALSQKLEGDCVVEYTVTAQGTVADPTVVKGACDPIFARPSIASASNFRYQPRIINGKAVAVPGVRNTFRFRIENQ